MNTNKPNDMEVKEIIELLENGKNIQGSVKVKLLLYTKAMNGNAEALIYLGKKYLGQTDTGIKNE